ncbi:MAG: TVP38/TMEM64 family protein [Myxococcota bacterium]
MTMPAEPHVESGRSGLWWKGALVVLLLVGLVAVDRVFGDVDWFATEPLVALLERSGFWAPLVLMAAMVLVVVAAPLPSLPLDVAAGVHFGWVAGGLYAAVGATVGALISFWIARKLGAEFVSRALGGHVTFCPACSDKLLTGVVFASRLIPAVSFDLVSYGAGLTSISPLRFGVATFLGMLPITLVYTYYGPELSSAARGSLWIGVAVAVALLLVPRAIEKWDLLGMARFFRHDAPSPEEAT